jgi:hypothetical protein
MGNIRFRRLEQRGARRFGDQLELAVPLPMSPNGMEVRRCPRDACTPRLFQLGEVVSGDDWSGDEKRLHRTPHTAGTTCPYCGYDSDDDHDFVDPRDIEALTEWFKWAAAEDATDAVHEMFKEVGRGLPRAGPISIEVTTNRRQSPEPRIWREDLLRDLICAVCSRRYGVYAIGLFCPDCGTPNLAVHFQRECELIEQQVELARQAPNPELSFRLLGNAHEDVVTALETYLKAAYRHLVKQRFSNDDANRLISAKSIGNAFQNMARAREKFESLQLDPYEMLDDDDFAYLRVNIEKRHVLGHNLGLADERYSEIDTTEQPGQTVVLLVEEVARFAQLAARVVGAVEDAAFSPERMAGLRREPEGA